MAETLGILVEADRLVNLSRQPGPGQGICLMRTLLCGLGLLFCLWSSSLHGAEDFLLKPIENIIIGREGETEKIVRGQKTGDDTLLLVPDTCFFSGEGKPTLAGEKGPPLIEPELNGGKSFSRIEGLTKPDQSIVWPVLLQSTGEAVVRIWCVNARAGAKLDVHLAGQSQTLILSTSDGSGPQEATAKFKDLTQGARELSFSPSADGGPDGAILKASISGPAIHDGLLLRARWRPAAVHGRFDSTTLKAAEEQARLWVMEVRPLKGEKGFYGPITTPFGYFGSTYDADSTSGGINFSMWSYGAKEKEPPVSRLSHLLALGDPNATFGRFDGEGHGVKLRNWNPYEGQKVVSTVLALRVDPGNPYDTYTGYYLDQKARTWKLYASGRKWVGDTPKKRALDLLPGCFVEVPGPPNVQRTGHITRAADFRGWCRDTQGKWHPIDQLHGGRREALREQTTSLWSVTPDGWFRLGMGGMIHYRYPDAADIRLKQPNDLPDYMAPERLAVLDKLPTVIAITRTVHEEGKVKVQFDLTGPKSKVKALFGAVDNLSFTERWQTTRDLGEFSSGHHEVTLPDAPATGFCRLILTNESGTYVTSVPGQW